MSNLGEAYIVDALRTPMGRGKAGCSLSEIHPADLASIPLKELVNRNKIDPKAIEDVILGCVSPIGEQGLDIARIAALIALDESVPGVQLNRMCSSGAQSIEFAANNIKCGTQDLLIAGGIEHMGRIPMMSDGLPLPGAENQATVLPESYLKKYSVKSMGQSGEMIAEKWGFTRKELDEFSAGSHEKAFKAQEAGYFKNEIVPVETKSFGTVDKDEGIRYPVDIDKMGTLPTPFKEGGVISPANASQITDGAAAVLLASEAALKKHNLKARAKIIQSVIVGTSPEIQLTGPIPAIPKILEKAGLKIEDIDLFEINEAFASVVLATVKETGIPMEKVNVNGGAIALGHPLGCSGARILVTLLNELERRKLKRGLLTMCVGFGQGIAMIIETV